jgi:arylsulfatase A-like enzyme
MQPVPEEQYLTDALGREAVAFVERHRAAPFFLYLAFNAPHTPLQAKPADLERVSGISDAKRRTYAAMICSVDDAVGRLLGALREAELEDDTLIFFLSDNGGPTSVTNSSNAPLRGAKGQLYEGGIRVPFVVRWPRSIPAGGEFHAPVSSLDIFPTALAAAGAPLPTAHPLDGVNLIPHWTGTALQPPHETLFWRTGGGVTFAVRKAAYKLVHQDGRDQLYDLENDLGETKNLAAEKPEIAALLQKHYDEWNSQLVRPLWSSPPRGKAKKKDAP